MKKQTIRLWQPPELIPAEVDMQLAAFPALFRQILFNRGIKDVDAASSFLEGEESLNDPFLMKGMDEAVERITTAIAKNQRIVIFGDYDVDGVTATVLLVQVISKLGGYVRKYIPNRFLEGYGFSDDGLKGALELNPDLIITVDCGIRSVDEISRAKNIGVDVIVTDHHLPLEKIPDACAVLCPWQPGDSYPYKELAGVGIAYKLGEALMSRLSEFPPSISSWLDLAAVGTVADVAPLTGENRSIVRKGLSLMRNGNRSGLIALALVSGIDIAKLTARDIGYVIGPRLNAAGRLSTAKKAYQVLSADSFTEAEFIARELDEENRERQKITKEIQAKAEENTDISENEWLVYDTSETYNEGVIGLAASRLAESFYRPAIIGTITGEFIKASCRSIPNLNITAALDQCAALLERHGGHEMAAGFLMKRDNEREFIEKVTLIVSTEMKEKDLKPQINYDAEVSISNLNLSFLQLINQLEPTGSHNPPPLFRLNNVKVTGLQRLGENRDHLKFFVVDRRKENENSVKPLPAIAFRLAERYLELKDGDLIDILFSFEENEYNGNKSLQLKVRDIKKRSAD